MFVVNQNFLLLLLLLSTIPSAFSVSSYNVLIDSDENCLTSSGEIRQEKNYANLLKFSNRVAYGQKNCSIHFRNPWLNEHQNGFGVSLPRPIDCGSIVTIRCLDENLFSNQTSSPAVQFNCHRSDRHAVLSCSAISVTYKRNIQMNVEKTSTHVQLVALSKGPCVDGVLFFSCSQDYPGSCIDAHLRCNGRSECPNGDDEFHCRSTNPAGTSILVIILAVLAFLFILCILSTVLICCFCRAAFNAIFRRFRTKKQNETIEKGDVTISGEDAGLIKGLTGATAMSDVVPPISSNEPTALMIDSTKPIYPRLE